MNLGAANLVIVVQAVRPGRLSLDGAVTVRPLNPSVVFKHLNRCLHFVVPADHGALLDRAWFDLKADNLLAFATGQLVEIDHHMQMIVKDVLSKFIVIVADWDAFRVVRL